MQRLVAARTGSNIACSGLTQVERRSRSPAPPGSFMNALTSVTKNAEAAPLAATATPEKRCSVGRDPVPAVEVDAEEDGLGEEREAFERERQTDDVAELAHEVGQSRPSSNESTVPETAPTAKRMAVPLASRVDSSR